jgi:hypothetical protein
MRDFMILKILDRLARFFTALGVDYAVMRRLLQVKLTLDGRRTATAMMQGNTTADDSNVFLKSLALYAFMGLFLVVFIVVEAAFVGIVLYFGVLMLFLAMGMISDFSAVLLDLSDKNIVHTKPVSQRTIGAAKTLHILIYLSMFAGSIAGPGIIALGAKHSPAFSLLALAAVIMICLLTLSVTTMLYTVLLKYYDGEKLKDWVNSVQIITVVALSVGYQLLLRVFNVLDLQTSFVPGWGSVLLPPVWFAAPFGLLLGQESTPLLAILALLGVCVPFLAFMFQVKLVSPAFERYVSKLATSARVRIYREPLRRRVFARVAALLTADRVDRALIKFANIMITTERSTKLRIYPNLAFALAFPVIVSVSSALRGSSLAEVLHTIREGNSILTLHMIAAMLSSVAGMCFYSDSYRGAWIFGALPVRHGDQAMKAAVKALILTYVAPLFALISLLALPLVGLHRLPDIGIMFLGAILNVLFVGGTLKLEYPFAEKFSKGNAGTSLVAIFIAGLLAGVHAVVLLIGSRMLLLGLLGGLLVAVLTLWNGWGRGKTARVGAVVAALLLVILFLSSNSQQMGNFIANRLTTNLIASLPGGYAQSVEASVRLGGDHLIIYRESGMIIATTCFYTEGGLTIAAAHSISLAPGEYRMQVNRGRSVAGELLSDSPDGIAIAGLTIPEEAPLLPLASPSDIALGEKALLIHSDGNIEVTVLGYQRKTRGRYSLVLQALDDEADIGPGYSGSPVIQDDRIIAFVFGAIKPSVRYSGARIAFARLATEVYLGTVKGE